MNKKIQKINSQISDYKLAIVNHPLYNQLKTVEDVQKLMEYHVYAVWDFMSLLKALQIELTCTTLPWKPVGDTKIRRLINSIVLEEESDVDADGKPSSHYEMYLDAMIECGAETKKIESFNLEVTANHIPKIQKSVDEFLSTTFDVINSGEAHKIAAAFTFGREDLIPDMFTSIVNDLNQEYKLDKFVYYLERHIELDGGEHGPLALQLITDLCGEDNQKWEEVSQTAKDCLKARVQLWDAILEEIN